MRLLEPFRLISAPQNNEIPRNSLSQPLVGGVDLFYFFDIFLYSDELKLWPIYISKDTEM